MIQFLTDSFQWFGVDSSSKLRFAAVVRTSRLFVLKGEFAIELSVAGRDGDSSWSDGLPVQFSRESIKNSAFESVWKIGYSAIAISEIHKKSTTRAMLPLSVRRPRGVTSAPGGRCLCAYTAVVNVQKVGSMTMSLRRVSPICSCDKCDC